MSNREDLKADMKQDRVSADIELAQAREALRALTEGRDWNEWGATAMQFPHALDMKLTDEAQDTFDPKSTEFQLFKETVEVLEFACYAGASREEANKALKQVLNKLKGPHTEEDMVKIQASLTSLHKITKEELEKKPLTIDEAKPWYVENPERAAVLNPSIKKFQNNLQNNVYQQMRDNYSR